MDNFKTRLKFYMGKAGMNPTSLSRKAGLNATAVRDILKHSAVPNPRIDTFIKLCHALNVGPHQLSPDFMKLYSPRQLELLDEISELNERDAQLRQEIIKEKNKVTRADETPEEE
jgi:transcriptional regulator with XRE-family HTH domain